jgi:hypothetical protein
VKEDVALYSKPPCVRTCTVFVVSRIRCCGLRNYDCNNMADIVGAFRFGVWIILTQGSLVRICAGREYLSACCVGVVTYIDRGAV